MGPKGRGNTWRHHEILDLLDIWGEQRIQQQLRASHRNFNVFEQVAEEMGRRGHERSAKECRTKTKGMRTEYRRVRNHNERSGSNASTCPYYKELHKILRGDSTVRPKRVAGSLKITRTQSKRLSTQATQPAPSLPVGSQDMFEEASETSSLTRDVEEDTSAADDEGSSNTHGDSASEAGEGTSTQTALNNPPEGAEGDSRDSTDAAAAPDPGVANPKATLSPASRLAEIRNRRSQKRGEDPALQIMRQAAEDNSRILQILERDSETFSEHVASVKQQAQAHTEQGAAMVRSVDRLATSMEGLVTAMLPVFTRERAAPMPRDVPVRALALTAPEASPVGGSHTVEELLPGPLWEEAPQGPPQREETPPPQWEESPPHPQWEESPPHKTPLGAPPQEGKGRGRGKAAPAAVGAQGRGKAAPAAVGVQARGRGRGRCLEPPPPTPAVPGEPRSPPAKQPRRELARRNPKERQPYSP